MKMLCASILLLTVFLLRCASLNAYCDKDYPIHQTAKQTFVEEGKYPQKCEIPHPMDKTEHSPRVQEIVELLHVYKKRHGYEALKADSKADLCARKFVSNFHFEMSCALIGNHLGSFLTGAVSSVVLNRTMFATSQMEYCGDYLYLREWVPTEPQIRELTAQAGCAITGATAYSEHPCVKGVCSTSPERVLCYEDLFNSAAVELSPITTEHVFGTNSYQHKASQILFGNTRSNLFQFESYGFLFHEIFVFSKTLEEGVSEKMAEIKTAKKNACLNNETFVTIGMHLRHNDPDSILDPEIDVPFDKQARDTLELVRNRSNATRCVVVIVTERVPSIYRIMGKSWALGCEVKFFSKTMNDQRVIEETGQYNTYFLQLADIFLAGHVDYFIGSDYSTYSWFIANIVAYRNAMLEHREEVAKRLMPPLHWVVSGKRMDVLTGCYEDNQKSVDDAYAKAFGENWKKASC